MISTRWPNRDERANKIYVQTTLTTVGRNQEGFWIDTNPEDSYANWMLKRVLDSSEVVLHYNVYGPSGVKLPPRAPHWEGDESLQR